MMEILWQTAVVMTNGITRSARTFKLNIFEIRSTTHSMEMLCLQKIRYMNYITYTVKIRGLSVEDLCMEKSSTPSVWIFSGTAYLK